MNNVCIIPARGGSRRLPKKNIKDFFGIPVIGLTIREVLATKMFSRVIVSTDDDEIAQIALEFGAEVPWRRKKELSDDFTSTDALILHELNTAIEFFGTFDVGCCVYPVNPFLTREMLRKSIDIVKQDVAPTCFSVTEFDFPVQQAFRIINDNPIFQTFSLMERRSQDLEVYYHDCGMFYTFNVERFLQDPRLISEVSFALKVNRRMVQDINTLDDWKIAEMKYIFRNLHD